MATILTPAKTPTVAIARVLRGLGLAQGKDFRVTGHYVRGERVGTHVLLLTEAAVETTRENADRIEREASAEGWGFNVNIRHLGNQRLVSVQNYGERFRDDAPAASVETEHQDGSRFCGECGLVFGRTADLNEHQSATGHEAPAAAPYKVTVATEHDAAVLRRTAAKAGRPAPQITVQQDAPYHVPGMVPVRRTATETEAARLADATPAPAPAPAVDRTEARKAASRMGQNRPIVGDSHDMNGRVWDRDAHQDPMWVHVTADGREFCLTPVSDLTGREWAAFGPGLTEDGASMGLSLRAAMHRIGELLDAGQL